ncbi:MAG: PAC2 family protein [Planctomycetota bacterium]|jgi:proteasome assembly chaperone (PAC2) family protein
MKRREKNNLRDPWLVAVWPGMGQVAAGAGSYLAQALKPEPAGRVPEHEFFSVNQVDVSGGIARTGRLPQSVFYAWRDPKGRRDLVFFIGEDQPESRGYAMCHRILDFALEHRVERVVTFAAMGTKMHPAADPRVFGAVTVPGMLRELRSNGVLPLREGQIAGLNGALLAAASERGVGAVCLLGEMPFYAAGVPNPKSSLAVLEAFTKIAGIRINLSRLERVAEQSQEHLTGLWEQLKAQASHLLERNVEVFEGMEEDEPLEPSEPETLPALDAAARRRIEKLFGAAQRDRARAGELKEELDRLGVFREYEDRFLDLFGRAG